MIAPMVVTLAGILAALFGLAAYPHLRRRPRGRHRHTRRTR